MLDMLYYVSIGQQPANCSGQNSVPLPCSKELFEAKSALAWRAKYGAYVDNKKGNGPITYGDLKRLRQSQSVEVDNSPLKQDLAEWCKDLDELGMLVFNAALMP